MPYSKELHIALLAVQRATLLTQRVYYEKAKGTEGTLSKDDRSPVTIGDFGAQALVIHALQKNFPDDNIIAEEDSGALATEGNKGIAGLVWQLVKETSLEDPESEKELGGRIENAEKMLEIIDGGKSLGGRDGRYWVLDPIDGTSGFLRGGQYAVCLALVEDGDVKVGVLGCPNLPIDDDALLSSETHGGEGGRGVLFSAVIGAGATSRPLGRAGIVFEGEKRIQMKSLAEADITQARFCESVEPGHSNHGQVSAIAHKLGIKSTSVRMDSQAKYGSIARGAGDLYLRLPTNKTYQEKIWDHAPGDLIVREAGGWVTNIRGERLDFGNGRTLKANEGIVAAPKAVHGIVLDAVKHVLSAE